ncbi:MAG: DEAD/DEAH box helicase [SAR86 cluster bacterium]|uniref:DEAD-box ATP-dependent RNA helicase RhpA n=1 Tax=SAR86 cluster bacterium TaxID=2030880 RepID=A0A937ICZ4_9GAMM|nr:DEAD/DEAH box helicase [SAR86 cluster bacterium]
MKFNDLNLSDPILRSLKDQNYKKPTPIQAEVIPAVLNNSDIMAAAQTGTGKTAAFVLPILSKLSNPKYKYKGHQLRALIVTPTRELAAQVRESVNTYSKYLNIRSTAVYGGARIHNQILKLRKGIDVLVATPGRLLDLHNQKSVNLENIEILVLDEADQMLDMGFIHDIKKIANLLPDRRQNLMFTATFSDSFRSLAMNMAEKAIEISVTNDNETGENINHYIHPIDKSRKAELLIELIKTKKWDQALVFTRTKYGADRLQKQLDKVNINSKAIHGNKTQNNRMKALEEFKNNKIKILVATDVAARGIDIKRMSHVINFDVPTIAKDYVHRIGRTGRGGDMGEAITLVSADEFRLLRDIEKLINKKLERVEIEGFEPEHEVPINDKPNKKRLHNKKGFKKRNKSRKG